MRHFQFDTDNFTGGTTGFASNLVLTRTGGDNALAIDLARPLRILLRT